MILLLQRLPRDAGLGQHLPGHRLRHRRLPAARVRNQAFEERRIDRPRLQLRREGRPVIRIGANRANHILKIGLKHAVGATAANAASDAMLPQTGGRRVARHIAQARPQPDIMPEW